MRYTFLLCFVLVAAVCFVCVFLGFIYTSHPNSLFQFYSCFFLQYIPLLFMLGFLFFSFLFCCLFCLCFSGLYLYFTSQFSLPILLLFFSAIHPITVHAWISFLFFFVLLFRATLVAYGGTQARALIGAIAASLHHSHSNAGSETHWQPTP